MLFLLNTLESGLITGGNRYNIDLINKLQSSGVEIIYKSGKTVNELLEEIPDYSTIILDSICLTDLSFDWKSLKNNNCHILLHMAPSESSEWKETEREQLEEVENFVFRHFPILALSHASISYIEQKYSLKVNFKIIPNFRELNFKKTDYKELPSKFISVGSISKDKANLTLIESLILIKEYEWTCYLYGAISDKPYYNQCKGLVDKYNLNQRVIFCDMVEQKKLYTEYCKVDLLIHCSLHENHSMAIYDSVLIGLPFITTPTGAYEFYLKEKAGIVSNGFEANHISDSIKWALNKENYRELTSRSIKARKRILQSNNNNSFLEIFRNTMND